MREININVGSKPIGKAKTWAYPSGQKFGFFFIPTYEVTVSGLDDNKKAVSKVFEALRFGIKCEKGGTPHVVGLADQQTHIIKSWLPHYTVHSADSTEKGAWQVYGNFLIHDGPDLPFIEAYASVGCVEICHGPAGFDQFNDFLISVSGSNKTNRDSKLIQIGSSNKVKITYQKAKRPSFTKFE